MKLAGVDEPQPVDEHQQRVERVLEEGLERVQTLEEARAVVERIEQLTAGQTEADAHDPLAEAAPTEDKSEAVAAATVAGVAERPGASKEAALAETLTTTAAETVAPTPAAPKMVEAAQAALTPSAPVSPAAKRGRELLKEATLRRMGPLAALDARLYLAVNSAPHPGWLDSIAWAIALIFIGGWVWVIGTLVAYLLRVPRGWLGVMRLLPAVVGATWVVEYPIKAYFRRRRPFASVVAALVIGKKPGSWSFPSGHTASSFASAWVLSTVWPRRAPLFFSLASLVGLSRVYVGAHYPGDVASGAIAGTLLAELIRQIVKRLGN
jgi:undecaprenyl-diphosphatase